MNKSISQKLRNNPEDLLENLGNLIHSPELQTVVRVKLNEISEILKLENEKVEQRKQLSRKIGIAKRSNEDCSALIAQVSLLSTEIKEFKQQLKDQIDFVESELARNSENYDDTAIANLPMHMQWHLQSDRTLKELPDTAESNQYSTSHSRDFDQTRWQSFVANSEHATVYHDPRWKSIIERNFHHNHYLVTCCTADGELAGLLPLVHLKSRLFGSFTTSMPYFNYGGPLARCKKAEAAMMKHAADLSASLGCSYMEIRQTYQHDNWPSKQRKVSMILPLPEDDKTLDQKLGSKLRAQVKKARSHQLDIEFGGIELLDDFYSVFSQNMRDLGTPIYHKKFFLDILESFPGSSFISVVHQRGVPLATGFLIGYRDKLEIPWASSIRNKNHLGANMLMYREILSQSITRGYRYFDFGRSTRDAPTHRFKKQWGCIEHQLHWHYWTEATEDTPELNPDNPKFKLAIAVWQRLPVFITRTIGPPLAKNLP